MNRLRLSATGHLLGTYRHLVECLAYRVNSKVLADGLMTTETMRAFTLGMCQQMMQKLTAGAS